MFLLLISKLINFVKNNEKDILNNKFNDLSLKYIILSLNSGLHFENKLNSYIYNYIKDRKNFTIRKFMKKDYNYDEKDYNYNISTNLNFLDSNRTYFLFNEKKKSTNDLFDKFLEIHSSNNNLINQISEDVPEQELVESNDF